MFRTVRPSSHCMQPFRSWSPGTQNLAKIGVLDSFDSGVFLCEISMPAAQRFSFQLQLRNMHSH